MPSKNPTLEDIARSCGVSRRVVSAILAPVPSNQRVRFSEQTRDRVEREALRLDYRPNRTSRAMKSARHQQIGVLLRNVHAVQEGVMAPLLYRAQQHGLSVVYQLHPLGQEGLPQFVCEDMVDGIIVFEDFEQPIIEAIDRYGIPLVMVNTFRRRRSGLVDLDEVGAVRAVTAAFAAAGRHKVHGLFSDLDRPYNRCRITALKNACHKHGMQVPLCRAIRPASGIDGMHGDAGALIVAEAEAALAAGCDAFYVQHDYWAAPLYRVLEARGLVIPDQVSVACHHLRNPEVYEPRLGGLVNPLDQGIVAVDLLEEMIAGRDVGSKARVVPYRFHAGGSIGR